MCWHGGWAGVITLAMLALGVVLGIVLAAHPSDAPVAECWAAAAYRRLMEQFFPLPFVGIATIDLDKREWGRINQQFADIVACFVRRMRTMTWASLVSRQPIWLRDLGALRGSSGARVRMRWIAASKGDGSSAWVNLQIRRLTAAQEGDIAQCVVVMQDITVGARGRIQRRKTWQR